MIRVRFPSVSIHPSVHPFVQYSSVGHQKKKKKNHQIKDTYMLHQLPRSLSALVCDKEFGKILLCHRILISYNTTS